MRLRVVVIAALVLLACGVGYTTHGWLAARSQLTQELNALKTANARSLHSAKVTEQREFLAATAYLRSELKVETQLAQAEEALANQPVYVTIEPTTSTTLPPPTPLEECFASGDWVYDGCANVEGGS